MRVNKLTGGFRPHVIITSTPKGVTSFKDFYMKDKKLKIENYEKDLNSAVFWGWDVIEAAELEESYIFQLAHRTETKLRVYISLGRILQQADTKSIETFYQCYIHDDSGDWDRRIWLNADSINYKTFWNMIEKVVDEYHPILPF